MTSRRSQRESLFFSLQPLPAKSFYHDFSLLLSRPFMNMFVAKMISFSLRTFRDSLIFEIFAGIMPHKLIKFANNNLFYENGENGKAFLPRKWEQFCFEIYDEIRGFKCRVNPWFHDLTTTANYRMRKGYSTKNSQLSSTRKKTKKLLNACLLSSLNIHDIYRSGLASKRSVKHAWFRAFMVRFVCQRIRFAFDNEEKTNKTDCVLKWKFHVKSF